MATYLLLGGLSLAVLGVLTLLAIRYGRAKERNAPLQKALKGASRAEDIQGEPDPDSLNGDIDLLRDR